MSAVELGQRINSPDTLPARRASYSQAHETNISQIRDLIPQAPDFFQAFGEWQLLFFNPVFLYGSGVERGHGQPVMPIPCFEGNDVYLSWMRGWLDRMGYRPYPSNIRNRDSIEGNIDQLTTDLEHIKAETKQRTTLVGHSLGGIEALYLEITRPDLVEEVISLGSPVSRDPRYDNIIDPTVQELLVSSIYDDERMFSTVLAQNPLPKNTKYYSLYTPEDRVIKDEKAFFYPGATEVIKVHGTHTGLAWNGQVFSNLGRLLHEIPAA